MANGYAKMICDRIEDAPAGTLFINPDFSDIAASKTVRRNPNRLVKDEKIRRLLNGLYEKPKYSNLL